MLKKMEAVISITINKEGRKEGRREGGKDGRKEGGKGATSVSSPNIQLYSEL